MTQPWPKLQQWGWKGPNICILCKPGGEVITHLILYCAFSCTYGQHVWISSEWILIWQALSTYSREPSCIWFASMPLPRLILIASICWNNIWRKRNNWIFNNIARTLATCLVCIYFDVIFCTGYLSEGEGDADPRDSREVVAGISSRPLGNHNTARDSKDTHLHWIGSWHNRQRPRRLRQLTTTIVAHYLQVVPSVPHPHYAFLLFFFCYASTIVITYVVGLWLT